MHFFVPFKRLMYQVWGYFWYLLTARHRGGYGLHSPFMFGFQRRVLAPGYRKELRQVRKRIRALRRDQRELDCGEDPGAGSNRLKSRQRKLKHIVAGSSVPDKYGKILYAAALEFKPETILELGASVGISTMYMCEGAPQASVYTMEACSRKLEVCRENARYLGHENLYPIQGTFEEKLPGLLEKLTSLDMVFIDGDHRKEKIMDYFEQIMAHIHDDSLVILDDIHWSPAMTQAWQALSHHPRVKVSVDLFRMGILFFKRELSAERFKIAY